MGAWPEIVASELTGPIIARPSPKPQSRAGLRRAAAALGAIALAGALSIHHEWAWSGGLACLGAALVGWARWPGGWQLARFALVNAVLLALLGWSTTERSELRVDVAAGRVVASLGSVRLETTALPPGEGTIEVALASADQRPLVARWARDVPSLGLEAVSLTLSGNLRSGVEGVSVSGLDGALLAGPTATVWQAATSRDPPVTDAPLNGWTARIDPHSGPVISVGDATWRDYRVTVPILRPSSTVRVVLPADDQGRALVVVAAPDARTFSIDERQQAGPDRALAGGLFAYRRDAPTWCQALVRELLRPWLFVLILLGACEAIAAPRVVVARPAGLPGPPPRLTAAILGGLAIAATAPIAAIVLEGIPHVQDSVTYLFQAQTLALGRLSAPPPPLPEFFEQEFALVHRGQWFGKYPPGQPLMLLLGILAGFPWMVSPLLAGGTVALTYLAGRLVYGHGTGLLAGVLMISSPFFLFMSGSMMSHSAGLFWAAALLYAVVLCRSRDRLGCWLWGGVAFGMLFITRQLTAIPIATPLLLVLLQSILHAPRRAAPRAALFAAGAAPPLLFLMYSNWRLAGHALQSFYELWWTFDRVGFGPTIGMHDGHDLANGLANTWANGTELLRHLWGWPAYLTLAPAMVPLAIGSRKAWDWILASCAAGVIAAYVFYWADGIMYGPRYYYEVIGALALLTARGFALLADGPGAPKALPVPAAVRMGWTARGLAVAAILTSLLTANLLGYLPSAISAHRGYNGVNRARLDLVEQAGLVRALVFVTQQPPNWQPYGSVFPANGPLLDGNVVFARDLGSENRRLIDVYPDRRPYRLTGLELTELPR